MRRAILVLCAVGCSKGPTVVARLDETVATVERMPEANAAWEPANKGDTFVLGSGVRTGKASRAHLRVGTRGKLDLDPESIVYFRIKGEDSSQNEVRVEMGRVELEAGDEAVAIGTATLESGGRAEIAQGADGTQVMVKIGRVVLEDSTAIEPGQRAVLDRSGKRVIAAPPAIADKPPRSPTKSGALLITVTGNARVKTAAGDSALDAGDHQLEPGAKLSVPEGTTVRVARGDAQLTVSGPGEFTVGGSPETLATIARGGVALESENPAAVAVPGGVVAVRDGNAAAQVDRDGSTITNRSGETVIRAKAGDKKLAPGEIATLAPDGIVLLLPPPPARAVIAIAAGESATLHDASAPTAIRLKFPEGCTAGLVEVAKDRTFRRLVARSAGTGGANVLLPPGSSSYRVRCDGGRILKGTLTLARDSGRAPLPKAAARTLVEMDGREYTILYQNLLPQLTLSWRNPAFAVGYTFVVKSATSERRFPSPAAKVILKPGDVPEGSYKVWVESQAGARSETSRMIVEFDNATPSASIDGVEHADGKFRVKGTVLEGSTVSSSAGVAVELDRHRRFSAELVPGANEDGAAVRIAHPKLGIHYYVLRTGK